MSNAAKPKKDGDDKNMIRITFTCTEAEKRKIKKLAKAHGIFQFSVFCRLAALGIIKVDRTKIEKKKP